MQASELVAFLTELIAKHGDLEIVFDSDSVLTGMASVEILNGPYPELPIFLDLPQPEDSSTWPTLIRS